MRGCVHLHVRAGVCVCGRVRVRAHVRACALECGILRGSLREKTFSIAGAFAGAFPCDCGSLREPTVWLREPSPLRRKTHVGATSLGTPLVYSAFSASAAM